MKRSILVTISFLMIDRAIADEWLCRTQSSQQQGSSIYACGIATAPTEDQAREKALSAAKREFTAICDLSETCRDHVANVSPQRTECFPEKGQIKCYRGVIFEPTDKLSDSVTTASGVRIPNKPKAKPRIYIDQTVQELLKELGAPDAIKEGVVIDFDPSHEKQIYKMFFFTKQQVPGCKDMIGCWVRSVGGRVVKYDSAWDPMMTDVFDR